MTPPTALAKYQSNLTLLRVVEARQQQVALCPAKRVHVDKIISDVAYRNRGIGKRFVQLAESWALQQLATKLTLSVFAFNEIAVEFYKSSGFAATMLEMEKLIQPSR